MKESRAPAEGGKVLPLRIGKDFPVSSKVMSFLIKRNLGNTKQLEEPQITFDVSTFPMLPS